MRGLSRRFVWERDGETRETGWQSTRRLWAFLSFNHHREVKGLTSTAPSLMPTK